MVQHSQPWLTEADHAAVASTMTSGMIAGGECVGEFERAIADYTGCEHAVAVSHGRHALSLILLGLDVGEGCEVIIPTYACPSLLTSVRATGATPVPVDAATDWCLDSAAASRAVSVRTKAVVAAHVFGVAASVDGLEDSSIALIEDCAQAFGGRDAQGRLLGSIGTAAFCSFQATKPLTAGHGGMVFSNRGDLISKGRYVASARGIDVGSFAMTDMQASLGLSQLGRYENALARRRQIADIYFTELRNCAVELPEHVRARSMFFRFPLRHRGSFEAIAALLQEQRIVARRGVDSLIHRVMGLDPQSFPNAERLYAETLSIPIYPAMTEEDVGLVVDACRRVLA